MILGVVVWILSFRIVSNAVIGDFKDARIDPCCEHLRVHYKQQVVYQILNLQHEDLESGINCFQRVCPSQFPAFYRIMYVGGLPGTSVSFAVCSNESNATLDATANHKLRFRRDNLTSFKWRTTRRKINASEKIHGREIAKDPENISYRSSRKLGMVNRRFTRKWQRTKREGSSSRTIFEIPEPRPSIVYTLTGACFCLKVVSPPRNNQSAPSTSRIRRRQFKIHDSQNPFQSSSPEGMLFKGRPPHTELKSLILNRNANKLDSKNNASDFPHQRELDNSPSMANSRQQNAAHQHPQESSYRSSFLDSFVDLIFPKQRRTSSPLTTRPFQNPGIQVTHVTKLTERKTLPVVTASSPSSYSNPTSADPHRDLRDNQNGILIPDSSSSHQYSEVKDRPGLTGDDFADDDDDVAATDDGGDSPTGEDEFANRLVVFASFSHDVHFIGSISMTVSVASSCRSSTPVLPGRQNWTNYQPGNPISREGISSTSPFPDISDRNFTANITMANDDNEMSSDELLVWQIASGGVFLVFLVVTVVLCVLMIRRSLQAIVNNSTSASDQTASPPVPPIRTTSAGVATLAASAPSSAAPGIQRGAQSRIASQSHNAVQGTGSPVYPMHIRLRSLSAAKEAARLRGVEALRMLNNEESHVTGHQDGSHKTDTALVPVGTLAVEQDSKSKANRERSLNPKIIVSNGSTKREFDLGKFAVYRNDIVLKLRSVGLRPGRKKDKTRGNDRDYDNMELGQDESVYACYAGGETDI